MTTTFGYNPSSQIISAVRRHAVYAWDDYVNIDHADTANGLNQLTSSGGIALSYDERGNLTGSGAANYAYDSQNRMTSAQAASTTSLLYDPLGRLREIGGATGTRWVHDGGAPAAEMAPGSGSGGPVLRRYVPGPGVDEVLVWYEGAGTNDRRWLVADERGSVVAETDSAGTTIHINRYDVYGVPAASNMGRFQYTGQTWLPEVQLYNYKARIYSPSLGRFMQTDPIGYADGMNLYAYVGNDPVNMVDPTGMVKFTQTLSRGVSIEDDVIWAVKDAGLDPTCPFGFQCPTAPRDDYGFSANPLGTNLSQLPSLEIFDFGVSQNGPQKANQKSDPCAGSVRAVGVSVAGILGLGPTASFGKVTVNGSGASSWFFSFGFGAGADVGVAGFATRFNSLSSFQGYSESYNGSVPLLGRTVGYSRSYDGGGNHTGDTLSGSGVPGLPGLRAGLSGTATDTTLLGGQCSPK